MDIMLTCRYNLNWSSVSCILWKTGPNAFLPYVMQEYFWHCVVIIACKGSHFYINMQIICPKYYLIV